MREGGKRRGTHGNLSTRSVQCRRGEGKTFLPTPRFGGLFSAVALTEQAHKFLSSSAKRDRQTPDSSPRLFSSTREIMLAQSYRLTGLYLRVAPNYVHVHIRKRFVFAFIGIYYD